MTLAACWEETPEQLPADITATLEASGDPRLSGLTLLAAIPEYMVELPGGKTASQTDVLAIASNSEGLVVLAVEGKVNEPFGPTLGEKNSVATPGQSERMAFLHRILGVEKSLDDTVRYQLLHRTVSAILVARDFHAATAVMLVHSFSPEGLWFNDYRAFGQALGADVRKNTVVMVPGRLSPRLFLGWCPGNQDYLAVDTRT